MARTSLSLFCKVVDNFGDIGSCWRLAQQLQREHGITVTLWVDDLPSFQRICPDVILDTDTQHINNILVRYWRDQDGIFTVEDISDIVIEFFGCNLPPAYITAMAQRVPQPVWLNLEGLSAEKWVEGCHTLPSPHPSLPLTKYFFFPGFTNKTGGLLCEAELDQQRHLFQQNPAAIKTFFKKLGVTPTEMPSTKASLFCYPHAPVLELFQAWRHSNEALLCLVPEGVASDAISAFFGHTPKIGSSITKGTLTVRIIPFLPQPDYDKLLWACDLNFVRGEDSFVRAQWAIRPFIWHIYPQNDNLHHTKLNAFLHLFTAKTENLITLSLTWNGAGDEPVRFSEIWPRFKRDMPKLATLSAQWQQQCITVGDLTSNIMKFADRLAKNPLQK